MGVMTVSMDDEIEAKFRKLAAERYGIRKGYLGDALSEAVSQWLREGQQKEIAERAIKLMEKGFYMGKKLYRTRDDIYDRF